jgi:MraZ protein
MFREEVSSMFGKYTHNFDPKGRLFVPAKLREELGSVFYVVIGMENSLLVFPEAKWAEVMERINAAPLSNAKAKRFILANVAKCEPDKQGRFVVPPILREYANLTENVTFLGEGDHAEIWNAEDYAAKEAAFLNTPGSLANALKELGL